MAQADKAKAAMAKKLRFFIKWLVFNGLDFKWLVFKQFPFWGYKGLAVLVRPLTRRLWSRWLASPGG